MAKKIDPRLIEILKAHDESAEDAMWDCHGTWVIYHRAIERIAAKAGVVFDMPEIVEAKSADKIVAIAVRGVMGDRSEWSFGEAAPSNNKNAYPYAMAEKRAKDRVVLKLVGLHGLAYSEEESDDFRPKNEAANDRQSAPATKSSAQLKRDGAWDKLMFQLSADFGDCKSLVTLSKLRADYRERARAEGWPKAWLETLANEFDTFEQTLEQSDDALTSDNSLPVGKNAYADSMRAG